MILARALASAVLFHGVAFAHKPGARLLNLHGRSTASVAQLSENIKTRVSIVKMNEYCQTCWHLPGIVKFMSVESTDCNASHKQIQNLEGACVSYLFPTSGHVSIFYMCVSNYSCSFLCSKMSVHGFSQCANMSDPNIYKHNIVASCFYIF